MIFGKTKGGKKGGGGGVPNNINYQDYTLSKYYNLKEHETYQVDIQGENYKDLYSLSHCEGEGIPGWIWTKSKWLPYQDNLIQDHRVGELLDDSLSENSKGRETNLWPESVPAQIVKQRFIKLAKRINN